MRSQRTTLTAIGRCRIQGPSDQRLPSDAHHDTSRSAPTTAGFLGVTLGPARRPAPSTSQDPIEPGGLLDPGHFTVHHPGHPESDVPDHLAVRPSSTHRDVVLPARTPPIADGHLHGQIPGPTVTSITGITTPRNTAVPDSTAIVTFSSAIDPTTFTTSNLTLTKNGTAVTPLTNVTIVATDATNTTFYVNGLSGYTTPPVQPTPPDLTPVGPDSYVLTVDATGIKAANETPVTGSQSSSFVIDTIPPQIVPLSPLAKSENPVPDNTVLVTFTKPIDPTTFTPAAT